MVLLLLSGCSNHPSLPQDYKQESGKPDIYPDYTDVKVPVNIAPLNFMVEQADEVVAHFKAGDTVDENAIRMAGLIGKSKAPLKVLGNGEIAVALTVKANKFSAAAKAKIEAAGGKCETV